MTKVLVVTGFDGDTNNPQGSHHAEVADLLNPTSICEAIQRYPIDTDWAVGLSFHDLPVICGGEISNVYIDDCYSYSFFYNNWTDTHDLLEPRAGAVSLQVDFNEFWIMGGMTTGDIVLDTTEVYDAQVSIRGIDLPEPMAHFSAVRLNSTHAFIASGLTSNSPMVVSKKTFLLDFHAGKWISLSDIPASDWTECHSSGFFINQFGEKEIVVVGRDSTWIFNFNSFAWRPGNAIPGNLWCSGSVQFENHFLVIGGSDEDFQTFSQKIFSFGASEQWVAQAATLDIGRINPVPFKISDENADCVV